MKTDQTDLLENQPTRNIQDFARQIWLAGLGAFASAQEESGKVFNALVEEGQVVDAQMKPVAEQSAGQTKDCAEAEEIARSKAENIQGRAAGAWSKLEEVFQARVTRALSRLGVPTRNDILQLLQQVDQLSENIQKLKKIAERDAAACASKGQTAKAVESSAGNRSTEPVG